MIEQEIERKIGDFRELGLPSYFPRNGRIHSVDYMVSTIIGARRSGKSFRMIQEASEWLEQKKIQSINHICRLDFDNPILSGLKANELSLIQSTFLKLTPDVDQETPLLFLLAETRRLFDEYLAWGAYPAIANLDKYLREPILREYFDTMILKDIIQRYNVSKPQQCIQLCRYLLANIGKPYTLQSAYRYLKQSGLENMIFLHLRRNWPRVHYYLTGKKRQEVDFIVADNHGTPIMALQVCLDISEKSTIQRELDSLAVTANYFKTKINLIT